MKQNFENGNGKQFFSITKIAYCALFTALSMILSYVEALIPAPVPVPGIKLGLANLAVVTVLYLYSWKEAAVVSLLRILLTSLLFGNVMSLSFSLAGGFLSLLLMAVLKKLNVFVLIGVSMVGGIMHNIGQILVAIAIVQNLNIGLYVPFLLISGALTGCIMGYLTNWSLKILKKIK